MQKILETLKRKETCWPAILLALIGIIVYLQIDRSNLQIDNEKLQKTVEIQQTEKKKMQTEKKKMQADKEQLKEDKRNLQTDKTDLQLDMIDLEIENTKLSIALEQQLSREISLKKEDSSMGDSWALWPIVGVDSDLPLAGYAQDTKSDAKKVPLLLKSEYSKVFFQLKFSSKVDKNGKIYFFQPDGKELEMVVKKKQFVLLPLSKKGIYYLKFSNEKEGVKFYIALKWKGKNNK